jgi:hypothetical protein
MLGMPAAEDTGWMAVAVFQSGWPIESRGGSESSESMGGVTQVWSP